MMICENDKLNIPEKYKKMSVSELRKEKERIYMEIRQQKSRSLEHTRKTVKKNVTFNF